MSDLRTANREGFTRRQRAALGHALLECATEIAAASRASWELDQIRAGRDAEPHVGDDIVYHNVRATTSMADHLTGAAPPSSQLHPISRVRNAPAHESLLIADVAKLYLRWRDLVVAAIRDAGDRLRTPDEVLDAALTTVRAATDSGLVLMARQYDERHAQVVARLAEEHARLQRLSDHDSLTGLADRAHLYRLLRVSADQDGEDAGLDAALVVDVEDLGAINDSRGYAAGDEVLAGVARRLTEIVRPGDSVARLAGDRFVIIARGLVEPETDAVRLANRIHARLATPVTTTTMITVSVSIGVTRIAAGDDPDAVVARADRARHRVDR